MRMHGIFIVSELPNTFCVGHFSYPVLICPRPDSCFIIRYKMNHSSKTPNCRLKADSEYGFRIEVCAQEPVPPGVELVRTACRSVIVVNTIVFRVHNRL